MLLRQRRSKTHLMWLEPIIKTLKKKIIQHLRRQPQRKVYSSELLKKYLKDAVTSYNNTINNFHKLTPKEAHNVELDPWHRKVQFPKEKLEPFDRWYTAELKDKIRPIHQTKKLEKTLMKKFSVWGTMYS